MAELLLMLDFTPFISSKSHNNFAMISTYSTSFSWRHKEYTITEKETSVSMQKPFCNTDCTKTAFSLYEYNIVALRWFKSSCCIGNSFPRELVVKSRGCRYWCGTKQLCWQLYCKLNPCYTYLKYWTTAASAEATFWPAWEPHLTRFCIWSGCPNWGELWQEGWQMSPCMHTI